MKLKATSPRKPSVEAPASPQAQVLSREAGPEQCRNLAEALTQEWVATNGLGGYAASTIVGVNTRRYHGLLVAATRPPGGRAVLLAKLEETIVTPSARYEFSTNRYADVVHPEGYRYQEAFRLDPWPTFVYRMGGILLTKEIRLIPGENTVLVRYRMPEATGAVELIVRPLVAARDFRWVSQENPTFRARLEQGPGTLSLHPYESLPPLILHHGAELFEPTATWYKRFEYLAEVETEVVHHEDLFSPGQLVYVLRPGETAELIASTDRTPQGAWHRFQDGARHLQWNVAVRAEESLRLSERRIQGRRVGPWTAQLMKMADQFLVQGADGARFCIAGYPWFSAWGRDALVSLPGLTLAAGQPQVARELLLTMAGHCRDGLLPVRFTEEDGTPEYDSADTSLWFFWAVGKYLTATGDLKFIGRRLLDVLLDIVDYYVQGTQFHIAMDEDGLITTEGEALPMTWMDAQVEGQPVTLRAGKAVEVNALWYNALITMADLGERLDLRLRRQYARLARLIRVNFLDLFWNAERGCLFDVAGPQADDAVRPNQLLAVSLPYPLLPKAQARSVLEVVTRELLTPVGVRTLSPAHPAYRGRWAGNQLERDRAATQGCAWGWLLGPYWSACLATYGRTKATRELIRQAMIALRDRLEVVGWGAVPELFDGDAPHAPGGALHQAWSVAEILRLLEDAQLTEL